MRSITSLLLCCILYAGLTQGQIKELAVVGIWQLGRKELIGLDNYQFFPDGKFCFNTNRIDETERIISIGGTFSIKGDTLILRITYSKEVRGGYLVRSETAGGSGWEIEGGKLIRINYKSPKVSYLLVEQCDHQEDVPCILVDKVKFYLVEKDPNNY